MHGARWLVILLAWGAGCRPSSETNIAARPLEPPAAAVDLDPDPGRLEVRLVAERASDGSYRYSGARPGPTLRARVGDRVVVHLDNALTDPTTIHWHGVGVPNDMDGVPWVTGTVAPGESFTYAFTVERAGTFWYHPHFDTARQVDRGLHGLFVVEDPSQPALPELLLVFDEPDEGGPHPIHGHGRLGTHWTVNGTETPVAHRLVESGRMRARVLNASNTAYLWLESSDPSSLELRAVAGDQGFDGGPREAPVLVGPGDRVELELGVRSAASLRTRRWSLNGGEVPYAPAVELVRFQVDTTGDLSSSPDWPFSGALPTPDVARTDVLWALMGSDRSGRWTINAEVFPNITPETLPLGRPAIVEVRNMSPTEHPFHLHGFVFELLSRNGVAPPFRTIEDTINVRIRERLRLRVTPERPGDWMAHCHILPHADGGMMTVLRVPPQP